MDLKSNELRIGNIINQRVTGNELLTMALSAFNGTGDQAYPIKVTSDTLKSIEGNSNAFEYSGVPLTEDWLVRFGFDKPKGKNYYIQKDFNEDWKMRLVKGDDENTLIWQSALFGIETVLKYVHQLQNLYFALTGTELELQSAGQKSLN